MQFLKTLVSGATINPSISLAGSLLTYRLDQDAPSSETFEVNLDDVVAQYGQDHGVIAVGSANGERLVVETTAISVGYRGSPFVNTYYTARRDSPLSVYRSLGTSGWPATFVLTPYKSCALSECSLFFCVVEGEGSITVDGQPLVADSVPLLPAYLQGWLPISFSGGTQVQSGGSLSLTVTAPQGTEVHLEALAGALSQVRARNGDTVIFHAGDLPAGTKARIKAGYKYWPGKTDFVVDVV